MIGHMTTESTQRVVEGPNPAVAAGSNAAVGASSNMADATIIPKRIVACCLIKTDRYDHKRNSALGDRTTPYCIWDFLFMRDDGSEFSCHPEYSTTKFGGYEGEAEQDHELPKGPKGGKGGTEGKGTFKRFKKKGYDVRLRFDAMKRP